MTTATCAFVRRSTRPRRDVERLLAASPTTTAIRGGSGGRRLSKRVSGGGGSGTDKQSGGVEAERGPSVNPCGVHGMVHCSRIGCAPDGGISNSSGSSRSGSSADGEEEGDASSGRGAAAPAALQAEGREQSETKVAVKGKRGKKSESQGAKAKASRSSPAAKLATPAANGKVAKKEDAVSKEKAARKEQERKEWEKKVAKAAKLVSAERAKWEKTESAEERIKLLLGMFNTIHLQAIEWEAERAMKLRVQLGLSPRPSKKGKASGGPVEEEVESDGDGDMRKAVVGKRKRGDKTTQLSKHAAARVKGVKVPAERPDLVTMSLMRDLGLKCEKRVIGNIDGIEVGHTFFYRAAMVVVGLHMHWLNGIDYVPGRESQACAIVISGGYEDNSDHGESFWYTGQGGNDLLGTRKQFKDQDLKLGNLALKNSIDTGNPIRVMRGHSNKEAPASRIYSYDGLYRVVKMKEEKGAQGFIVYKFLLERMPGQADLKSGQVLFKRWTAPKTPADAPGVICEDLSGGKEPFPIVVTNLVDKEKTPKLNYIVTRNESEVNKATLRELPGCRKCGEECDRERSCQCAQLNREGLPYVRDRLRKAMGILVECGPRCNCTECPNKVAQRRGVRFRLEVFKTQKKSWGVRSWDPIPMGSVVCEYVGDIIKGRSAGNRKVDTYVIDIDTVLVANHGNDVREPKHEDMEHFKKRLAECENKQGHNHPQSNDHHIGHDKEDDVDPEKEVVWSIDGAKNGNVSRFINHSCDPNLFYQSVLWDHANPELSHLVLVAGDNIPPMTELTYDYGYQIGSVADREGNRKSLKCYCNARDCRGQLY